MQMRRGLGACVLRAGLLSMGALLAAHRGDATVALAPTRRASFRPRASRSRSRCRVCRSSPGGPERSPSQASPRASRRSRRLRPTSRFRVSRPRARHSRSASGRTRSRGPTSSPSRTRRSRGGLTTFALTITEPQLRTSITTPTITLGAAAVNVPVRVSVDPGFGLNAGAGVPIVFGVDTGAAARRRDGRRLEDRAPSVHEHAHVSVQPHGRPGARLVLRPADGHVDRDDGQAAHVDVDAHAQHPGRHGRPAGGADRLQRRRDRPVGSSPSTASSGTRGIAAITPVSVPAGITQTGPRVDHARDRSEPWRPGLHDLRPPEPRSARSPSRTGSRTRPRPCNKTFPVAFTVVNPDVAASTTASSISLQAGGASQAFMANTLPPPRAATSRSGSTTRSPGCRPASRFREP